MTTNFRRTADWLKACGKQPHSKDITVQIGCHIEEFAEFLSCLQTNDSQSDLTLRNSIHYLKTLGEGFKKGAAVAVVAEDLRLDTLDALCDTEVTGNGVAYLLGFNKEDADLEVLRSNDAKLVNGKPVILEGGKIGKPAGWVAPNLKGFV